MKANKILNFGKIFALILVLLAIIYQFLKTSDLKNNSIDSVAKIYGFSHTKYVTTNAKFEYYYKDERYQGVTSLPKKYDKGILNKFFEIKFSIENPRNCEIDLNSEVTDPIRIKEANFFSK